MTRRTTSSPKPWDQFEARTTFLRVPASDWLLVKQGRKTEFRATGRGVTQLWNVNPPTPVVAYAVTNARDDHDSRLMVLEKTWQEPLGAISPDSLAHEGFPDMASFRRYWIIRTKRRFRPLSNVQVFRVRPWRPGDNEAMGVGLLMKLYGAHL